MSSYFPKFRPIFPKIYAYSDNSYEGLLKIGFTTREVTERVKEQYPTARPGKVPYYLDETAMRSDGSAISDHEIHRYLRKKGFNNPEGEWFMYCRSS